MTPHEILSSHNVREWMRILNRMQPYRLTRALLLAVSSATLISLMMILGAWQPTINTLRPNFHLGYTIAINFILFSLLYIYNFWIIRMGLRKWTLVAAGLTGSLVISTLLSLLSYWVEAGIYGSAFHTFIISAIINGTSALIAYLLSLLLTNITEHQQTIIENEHLQAENMRIHHQALEQQLSPHFLFNSLNTLDGLIGFDDSRAHKYLQQLATTFRYTLQKQREVTLSDELAFTHAYIYMMQIRYGEALCIKESIDPALLGRRLPPISLQLLVENAIKHNVITTRRPLCITIETPTAHCLRVSNPLQPKADQDPSEGIGLSNLNQRYQMLYNKHIDIDSTGDCFSVDIPLVEE